MSNIDGIYELLTQMQAENRAEFAKVHRRLDTFEEKLDSLEGRLDSLERRVERIEGTVVRIENDHGAKLNILFDGYQQMNDKISRIEDRVTAQDEVILRRVFPQ